MKVSTTAERLKEYMDKHNLKQVDILAKTEPYCKKYNVKMNKSDISQYLSGKTEPGQDKLVVLAKALNVSEIWLMGYDEDDANVKQYNEDEDEKIAILNRNAKKLTPEQRQQLIDMAKVLFREDWND